MSQLSFYDIKGRMSVSWHLKSTKSATILVFYSMIVEAPNPHDDINEQIQRDLRV